MGMGLFAFWQINVKYWILTAKPNHDKLSETGRLISIGRQNGTGAETNPSEPRVYISIYEYMYLYIFLFLLVLLVYSIIDSWMDGWMDTRMCYIDNENAFAFIY